MVHGDVQKTVLTSDLGRLIRLEGCLERQRAGQQEGARQPAAGLPRDRRPASGEGGVRAGHVHQHGRQPDPRPAREAGGPAAGAGAAGGRGRPAAVEAARRPARRAAAAGRGGREGGAGEVRHGHPPAGAQVRDQRRRRASTTPSFVSALVFDRTTGQPGVPKSRFAYLFPSKNAALVQIRLRPDLTDAEQQRAIDLIRTATAEKAFKPEGRREVHRDRRSGGGGRAGGRRAQRRSSCCSGRRSC